MIALKPLDTAPFLIVVVVWPNTTPDDLALIASDAQRTRFDECRANIDFSAATLVEVSTTDETSKVPPGCSADLKQVDVWLTVDVRGTRAMVQVDDVRSFAAGWRATDRIKTCGPPAL